MARPRTSAKANVVNNANAVDVVPIEFSTVDATATVATARITTIESMGFVVGLVYLLHLANYVFNFFPLITYDTSDTVQ